MLLPHLVYVACTVCNYEVVFALGLGALWLPARRSLACAGTWSPAPEAFTTLLTAAWLLCRRVGH